jgi:hypothetical protein
MTLRTEQEIRDRLAELDQIQKEYEWTDTERAVHAKTTLRAQMKGLLFALREDEKFNIIKGD